MSSVGRNSLIMASGTAASRITGQIRTILLVAALGTTGLSANAYQAGSMIPQLIYTLVSGGIFNAVLVPQIVRTLEKQDAQKRLNKLITFAIMLLLAVTIIMTCLTPVLTWLYAGGGETMQALTNAFTLWCMPQIFFYGLYTVLGQILAAKGRFAMYAWSSVAANIVSCIGFGVFIALFGNASRQSLAFWNTHTLLFSAGFWTLGVAVQALLLFYPLTRIGLHYRPSWGIRGIGLRSMGPVAAWSTAIVVVTQLSVMVITHVTTSAPVLAEHAMFISQFDVAGNATYQNVYTIYLLPYSLVAVSVATALFPKISRSIALHNLNDARNDLSESLRNVSLIMCFFLAVFVVIPTPIAFALLPSVSWHEAMLMTQPLMLLAIGLPLASAYLIIQRTFYAFEDGKRPFIFAVFQLGIEILILLSCIQFLPPTYWVTALTASITVSFILTFPALVWMLRERFQRNLDGRRLTLAHVKIAVATLLAMGIGWLVYRACTIIIRIDDPLSHGIGRWFAALLVCAIVTLSMLITYVGVLLMMRSEEVLILLATLCDKAKGYVPFLSRFTHIADAYKTQKVSEATMLRTPRTACSSHMSELISASHVKDAPYGNAEASSGATVDPALNRKNPSLVDNASLDTTKKPRTIRSRT